MQTFSKCSFRTQGFLYQRKLTEKAGLVFLVLKEQVWCSSNTWKKQTWCISIAYTLRNQIPITLYMKNSSERNVFFSPENNSYSDAEMILPFRENDVLKIELEYVNLEKPGLRRDFLCFTPGSKTLTYYFTVKKWNSAISLLDFIDAFSHCWVDRNLNLFQPKTVDYQGITIVNQTAEKRVLNFNLDSSDQKNAYHFWYALPDIRGKMNNLELAVGKSYCFEFTSPVTRKAVLSTRLYFVSALLELYKSQKLNPTLFSYSFDQSSRSFIKKPNQFISKFVGNIECLLRDVGDKFLYFFSLKKGSSNDFVLEVKKEFEDFKPILLFENDFRGDFSYHLSKDDVHNVIKKQLALILD